VRRGVLVPEDGDKVSPETLMYVYVPDCMASHPTRLTDPVLVTRMSGLKLEHFRKSFSVGVNEGLCSYYS
jgi:hypothetical protein